MKKQNVLLTIFTFVAILALCILYFVNQDHRSAPLLISGLTSSTGEAAEDTDTYKPQNTRKIDINTATSEQLQSLPGVGPSLAQRIIDYRTQNGPFQTVSELTKVNGIGLSRLNQIMDYITAGGLE